MKTLNSIVLALSLALINSAFAISESPILWSDYVQAQRYALDSSKICVVILGADWCSYCVKLKSQTIKDIHLLNKAVICYVDIDKNPELMAKYKATTLPKTIYFKQGEMKRTIVGYHDINRILMELK